MKNKQKRIKRLLEWKRKNVCTDIVLIGVKPSDLARLPPPVRQKFCGGTELTWITVEGVAIDSSILEGIEWYVWSSHWIDESGRTLRLVTLQLPYFVTKVDFVWVGPWRSGVARSQALPRRDIATVIRWADWLKVVPVVGRVLDESATLVHHLPAQATWQNFYEKARSLDATDEVGGHAFRQATAGRR